MALADAVPVSSNASPVSPRAASRGGESRRDARIVEKLQIALNDLSVKKVVEKGAVGAVVTAVVAVACKKVNLESKLDGLLLYVTRTPPPKKQNGPR